MIFYQLFNISQADRNSFCEKIINASAPRADYYFLVVLSTLIVALGLIVHNIILVIGGMLVTPLLSPILAIALGIVINEYKVIFRSLRIIFMSFILAFLVAFITGFFSPQRVADNELIRLMEPSLFVMIVALIAGIAASYTWARPGLVGSLPGIAVTVTLIPPLTAIGLTVAQGEFELFRLSFATLFINIFGIIAASLVVFSLMEFYKSKRKVIDEIKEEEKEIKKEKKKAEKINNKKK